MINSAHLAESLCKFFREFFFMDSHDFCFFMKDVKFFVACIFNSTQNALLLKLGKIKSYLYLFKIIRNTLWRKRRKRKSIQKEWRKRKKRRARSRNVKKRVSQLTVPQWVSTATEPCTCAEQWPGRNNVMIENVYKASMWSSWQCWLLVFENGISFIDLCCLEM